MKTRTLDDTTEALSPGWLRVSTRQLYGIHPELASWHAWVALIVRERKTRVLSRKFWLIQIEEHLMHGDSRPALVVFDRSAANRRLHR